MGSVYCGPSPAPSGPRWSSSALPTRKASWGSRRSSRAPSRWSTSRRPRRTIACTSSPASSRGPSRPRAPPPPPALSAAQARLRKVVPSRSPAFQAPISTTGKTEIVVVGTATGGPQALRRLLTALPEDFPVPIAMVLHIPVGYTEALARRLDALSKLDVREASEGLRLRPGLAVLAKAGEHLEVVGRGSHRVARLPLEPADVPHRPSVDVLFRSAAAEYKSAALGIVLTGMGDDGLEGSRLIRAAGGRILAEAESSSIVYGMPRCVHDAGLAEAEAPIEDMAALLVRSL